MKLLFGNLKMNFLYKDFTEYLEQMRHLMMHEPPKVIVGLAIPYIYLREAAGKIGANIKVLAQDLHPAEKGAFTSQISASQIASIEVPATMVGHSECRKLSQNSLIIANKVQAALGQGLEVIYCCGADPMNEIADELKSVTPEQWKKVIIAYEPLESIGTGVALDASAAAEKIKEIKTHVTQIWGLDAAESARYLYGGSVNLINYKAYLNNPGIDGVLVGGASLKINDFWKMATLQ